MTNHMKNQFAVHLIIYLCIAGALLLPTSCANFMNDTLDAKTTVSGESGGITWVYDQSNKTLSLGAETANTELTGSHFNSSAFPSSVRKRTQVLEFSDDHITALGDRVFSGFDALQEATIPATVTSVGSSIFDGCSKLETIAIKGSTTGWADDWADDWDYGHSIDEPSVPYERSDGWEILDGTLTITISGDMPDYDSNYDQYPTIITPWNNFRSTIKKVVIESGCTSIGSCAFEDCSSLTSITIPSSVTSIGSEAFDGCSSLTAITIPSNVTSISDQVFEDCSSLTAITIPDSVTSIGIDAFGGCSSLTSITIPSSVTSIGSGAFAYCSSLMSITIPDSVMVIDGWTFAGTSLTSITIPDNVTSIGGFAFAYCENLTSITIPSSVTSIDWYAFSGWTSSQTITVLGDTAGWNSDWNYNCSAVINYNTN